MRVLVKMAGRTHVASNVQRRHFASRLSHVCGESGTACYGRAPHGPTTLGRQFVNLFLVSATRLFPRGVNDGKVDGESKL